MPDLDRLTNDLAVRLGSKIITVDLREPVAEAVPTNAEGALLSCQGLLEQAPDAAALLDSLSDRLDHAAVALVSIADRELAGGERARADARWNAAELLEMIDRADLEACWIGLTDAAGSLGRRAGITVALSRQRIDDVREALAGGPLGLGFDPAATGPARVPRVCIASYEFVGPTRTGGIGTAYTSLAETLAAAGHAVTLLFSGWEDGEGEPFRHWVSHYGKLGIKLERLPQPTANWIETGHRHAVRAYEVYRWLRARDGGFEVVHFPEVLGHGYYSICAKRLGVAFAETTLAVGTHSSTSWVLEANGTLYQAIDDFADDFIERRCVADCDALISPSAYMLDWMRARGWTLPQRHFVQQYARSSAVSNKLAAPVAAKAVSSANGAGAEAEDEIVFFGRLEPRKGLRVFCEALDNLATNSPPRCRVTFLGKQSTIGGRPAAGYVAERAQRWPWQARVIDDLGQPEAVAYLRAAGRRITVIPSLADNSPNTVYEALGLGIPFIASRVGGTAELIDPLDLAKSTFDPKADRLVEAPEGAQALASLLRVALASDNLERPRASVSADACRNAHARWHASVVAPLQIEPELSAESALTICLVGGDETRRRISAISIAGQTRAPAAVIEAETFAAARPETDLILFMAAGARLAPEAVQMLERAAVFTEAELIGVPVTFIAADREAEITRVPVGGPATAGLLRRGLGDASFLIRRATLERLGGADAEIPLPDQAHELLCRAVIAGVRIEVLPEPLVRKAPADTLAPMEIAEAAHVQTGLLATFARAPAEVLSELPRLTQQLAVAAVERENDFVRLYEHRFGRLTLPIRGTAIRLRRAGAIMRRRK